VRHRVPLRRHEEPAGLQPAQRAHREDHEGQAVRQLHHPHPAQRPERQGLGHKAEGQEVLGFQGHAEQGGNLFQNPFHRHLQGPVDGAHQGPETDLRPPKDRVPLEGRDR